jgi:hypothetical protein
MIGLCQLFEVRHQEITDDERSESTVDEYNADGHLVIVSLLSGLAATSS